MVFRNGSRMLWNPVKKQPLKFRPEELVRLRFLDYLLLQSDVPSSRIAVESPIPSRFSRGRTDLLCYNKQFQPWLLIECKAERVSLGSDTATQSATYNRFVKAPYILLTNGLQDALFDVSETLRALDFEDYPSELQQVTSFCNTDPKYWMERGFLPENMERPVATLFSQYLSRLFHKSSETCSYIPLSFPHDGMPLSHYYLISPSPRRTDTLIALSVIALGKNEAALCAIANQKKSNIACLRIMLDAKGGFHSPQLFQTGNDDIITPDILEIEKIWNEPDNMPQACMNDPFPYRLSESLDTILTTG